MVDVVNLRAFNYPLGGELNLDWFYSEEPTDQDEVFLFKAKREIAQEEIDSFFAQDVRPADIEISKLTNLYRRKFWDYDCELETTYYYVLTVARRNEGGIYETGLSGFANVKLEYQEIVISAVPTKEILIKALKKIIKVIASQDKDIDLEVTGKFPLLTEGTKGICVTRATSETAYRFWGNQADYQGLQRGEIEAESINVMWWVVKNPDLRDKLTDIFRGSKFYLQRYLKRQYKDAKIQLSISMMGDNEEYKEGNMHIFYGSMLVNFLIESSVTMKSPLMEAISVELNFETDQTHE